MRLFTVAVAALGISVAALSPAQAKTVVRMAELVHPEPSLNEEGCQKGTTISREFEAIFTGQPSHFIRTGCNGGPKAIEANGTAGNVTGGTGRATERQIRDIECKSSDCGGGTGRATERQIRDIECKSSNCGSATGRATERQIRDIECKSGNCGGGTGRATERQSRDIECKSSNCGGGGIGGTERATDRQTRSFGCKNC